MSTYCWISFREDKKYEHLIVKSIVANYILSSLGKVFIHFSNIKIPENEIIKTVCFMIFCFILGVIIGKLTTSEFFNKILHKIHIGRTTNNNIWDDIIKPGTWLRIYTKNENISYLGQFRYGEPFTNEPKIVLSTYQILDLEGNVLADYSEKPNDMVVLNTKDFDRIEITYSDRIPIIQRIKSKINDIPVKFR